MYDEVFCVSVIREAYSFATKDEKRYNIWEQVFL
jgi:hypothetical protein